MKSLAALGWELAGGALFPTDASSIPSAPSRSRSGSRSPSLASFMITLATAVASGSLRSVSGTSRACRSADRSRRYGRTGRPLQLQRLHDERELVGARLGEVLEHEVLEQMDTVDGKRDVVDRQIDRLVRIGGDFHRPVVRTKQHRVLLDQPLGRSHADSRTAARVEFVVDAPVLTPSGVNEHGITRLQAYPLLLQRLLQVGYGNLVVDWQNIDTLEARDVDKHATRHQGADLLHPHLGEAAAARDVVHLHAVVEQPVERLMGEPIELRSDLADLRNDQLLVAVALVRAEWAGAALGMQIVLPAGIERNVPS